MSDDNMMTWTGPKHVFDKLLRDRDRLDWLDQNAGLRIVEGRDGGEIGLLRGAVIVGEGGNLRAAIDAARKRGTAHSERAAPDQEGR